MPSQDVRTPAKIPLRAPAEASDQLSHL